MTQAYKSPAWRRFRLWVLERDGGVCQIRGPKCTHDATAVDHVIELADGGAEFDPANVRASCKPCNSRRAALRTKDRKRGLYRKGEASYETRM